MTEDREGRREWSLVSLVVGAALGVALVLPLLILGSPGSPRAPSPLWSCRLDDPAVPAPAAPHGLFVLSPPTNPGGSNYNLTVAYLLNNPAVCGANFFVPWSSIDRGPNSTPRYNWTSVDQEIQPWVQAGKEVNFIVWAVAYTAGPPATPAYVLQQSSTVQCVQPDGSESAVTPIYWQGPFLEEYEGFMRAFVLHFSSNPAVGYIRFGVGTGGEDIVVPNADSPACLSKLQAYGFTDQVWLNYSFSVLDAEKSLNSSVPLMTSINFVPGGGNVAPDRVAERAVADGIGFGYQGARASDITSYLSGQPCGADWCGLFGLYAGKVPLELQTAGPSSPNGSGVVGSLASLIPFALRLYTQCFELNIADWLITYAPTYPGYSEYHAAYFATFQDALAEVGGS
jgi:hypothetical protein